VLENVKNKHQDGFKSLVFPMMRQLKQSTTVSLCTN